MFYVFICVHAHISSYLALRGQNGRREVEVVRPAGAMAPVLAREKRVPDVCVLSRETHHAAPKQPLISDELYEKVAWMYLQYLCSCILAAIRLLLYMPWLQKRMSTTQIRREAAK